MGFRFAVALAAAVFFAFTAEIVSAQPDLRSAPVAPVTVQTLKSDKPAAVPATKFDPAKATNAYLARVSGEARQRSDSYFEGGYVLIGVDALFSIAVSALLLWSRFSAGMRNMAQRLTRSRFLQVPIYVAMFVVVTTILSFPLSVYEGFLREHAYGLSNQNFAQWFGDFAKAFGVQLVGSVIALTLIYVVIRGTRRLWWAWGSVVAVVLVFVLQVVAPVFVAPLFNTFRPVAESPVKEQVLALAKANGIPVDNVYEFDASRQSKRISANVSGLFGTTRISMNDNLMNRCTPSEIKAVLGHEMGHYVLSHAAIGTTWFGLVILVAFVFLNWGFGALTGIFGGNWDVRSIDDPAGLPVLVALLSLFFVLATPVTNTITRTIEAQADIFGLNAARQPDEFATATLKLSEYRKLDPSPLEEFVFYDHPSGRTQNLDRDALEGLASERSGHQGWPGVAAMKGFSLSVGAPGAAFHAAAHSHHPWPDVTLAAQDAAWRDAARLLDRKWEHVFGDVIPKAQVHVARELGLPNSRTIAFGPNTHSFVLRILSCVPKRPVQVLTTGSEFMSLARQLARLEEAGMAIVTRVPTEPFETFKVRFCENAARGRHDLVYASQVFFDSGFACRELPAVVGAVRDPGTLLVIDGYHGFMAVPTDLGAISNRAFYLAGGYKYAMAGEGACFLHCPPGWCPRPVDTGWYAGFSTLEQGGGGVGFAEDGSRFFGATFDVSGLYRFNAVQDWIVREGFSTARTLAHVRTLERRFVAELDRLGAPIGSRDLFVPDEDQRGRFLAFRTAEAAAIAARLAAANVIVDHRGSSLRIGFGIYHVDEDALHLAKAIAH